MAQPADVKLLSGFGSNKSLPNSIVVDWAVLKYAGTFLFCFRYLKCRSKSSASVGLVSIAEATSLDLAPSIVASQWAATSLIGPRPPTGTNEIIFTTIVRGSNLKMSLQPSS
eukprot:GILK01026179.1.p2 GENE.GILK01026179.1~~GILK01026179.1.p2  ORF type:complete len:112 (-),score=2.60 GILK01026179.1:106-441(-)